MTAFSVTPCGRKPRFELLGRQPLRTRAHATARPARVSAPDAVEWRGQCHRADARCAPSQLDGTSNGANPTPAVVVVPVRVRATVGVCLPLPPHPPPGRCLDAAATPLLPAARDTLLAALDAGWADPRRLHTEGRQARGAARPAPARSSPQGLGVRPAELSFLPSGPVALRAAVEGLLHAGRRRGTRLVASAVEHSGVLTLGAASPPRRATRRCSRRCGWTASAGSTSTRSRPPVARPGTTAAAVQSANGEVGTAPAARGGAQRTRAQGVPLLRGRRGVAGPRAGAHVVRRARRRRALVGRPRRRRGARRARAHPVAPRRARTATPERRAHATPSPWSPSALAAAEAWQQTEATRAAETREPRALVDRIRAAAAAIPDVEVVGDPRRPAAPRRDLLLPVRRRRGAGHRARPAGLRGGVGVGVHGQHARAEPRARRDGRADPRQRTRDPAPRTGVAPDREADVDAVPRRCCPDAVAPRCGPSSGRPRL